VTGKFGAGRCKDCVAAQRSTAAPLVHRYNCKCDRPTQGSSAHRSYAMRILLYPSIPAADLCARSTPKVQNVDQCMTSAWHTFRRRYCASVSDPCFRTNRERCLFNRDEGKHGIATNCPTKRKNEWTLSLRRLKHGPDHILPKWHKVVYNPECPH
jgi:hypothetical protein